MSSAFVCVLARIATALVLASIGMAASAQTGHAAVASGDGSRTIASADHAVIVDYDSSLASTTSLVNPRAAACSIEPHAANGARPFTSAASPRHAAKGGRVPGDATGFIGPV
ncbi:MAG: hypothetical protein MSC31_19495, partial [Solirubrobacteraceae bacterium MAG38_C4-C5]|nr:hypothetical protein [Candidatus Siliceabacter maunaloa]